jgi:hypothetical protein
VSVKERRAGVDTAHIALQLLDPDGAPPEQKYGWTLDQAADRISHLTGTKAEMLETIAFLACQVHGLREASDRDATLAINQVENIIARYRERKK